MRLRIRGPGGQSVANLADSATVADLQRQITDCTSIASFDLKYGYPPKPLLLGEHSAAAKLSALGIDLDGEQLIVSEHVAPIDRGSERASRPSPAPAPPAATPAPASLPPLSLARKDAPTDAPELPLPSHQATLLLRIMPDDNSCLFRAFSSAYFGAMDNVTELRSVVAQSIRAEPDKYPAVVLEKPRDAYCRWIQTADAWGGAIELDILARHFDVAVCSIDVQTLRVDRYNDGRPLRCILVYSGIHYDVIALSPSDPPHDRADAPPEFDTKVFGAADAVVLQAALDLCRVLQGRHYFTDTAAFAIRCLVCREVCRGERGATAHATETGHYEFGEAE
jgi:ubiquitin thioesterase OTU1